MTKHTRAGRAQIEAVEARRLFAVDLFPAGFSMDDPTIAPGQSEDVSYTIGSTGGAAGVVQVALRVAPLNPINRFPGPGFSDASSVAVGTIQGTFNASGSATATGTVSFPSDLPGGPYALMAKIDSAGAFAESDEADNVATLREIHLLRDDGVLPIDLTGGDDSLNVNIFGDPGRPRFSYSRGDIGIPNAHVFALNMVDDRLTDPTNVRGVEIRGLDGDDRVTVAVGAATFYFRIDGGAGNDTLVGNDGAETLVGGSQKDVIYGGGGDDRLNGNGGNDKLFGEAGRDRLFGYAGDDFLDGGSSNDRLDGGDGADVLRGNAGNDRLFARDDSIDHLFGDKGTDTARADLTDVLATIEPG